MRHKRARPKERPILSFLLNPFGLGFPRPGQPVRGEGCPRAHGHPSGDIQAVTNPWPPWRAPCAVGLCPAGWRGSSHCGSLSLGETAQDGPGRRPARGRSVWDGGARPRMEDISAVLSAKPQKQPSPPNSQHQPTRRPPWPEPSMATTASRPSSSGQVSPCRSRREIVLEGPQGPAGA